MSTIRVKPHLLTHEGLERLKNELHYLENTRREELAERLHRALEDGQDDDFVDNAALEAARNDQSFVEGRILELKDILSNYQLIQDDGKPSEFVRIGDTITVMEEGVDEEEVYILVGSAEADPAAGRISNESPLGRVLLGAKVGDSVRVNAPNGVISFRIIKIE